MRARRFRPCVDFRPSIHLLMPRIMPRPGHHENDRDLEPRPDFPDTPDDPPETGDPGVPTVPMAPVYTGPTSGPPSTPTAPSPVVTTVGC